MRNRMTLVETGYGVLIALLLFVCFSLQLQLWLDDDNTFYLFAAQRLLDGGTFLKTVHDVNPPLINYLGIPAVIAARLFSIPLSVAFIGYVYVLVVVCLGMIRVLVPLRLDRNPHFSGVAFALFAFFLVMMPGHAFAQREHLVCIFCAPWICLVARRWSGTASSPAATIACATLAAVGFALKPFFLPLPLAVFVVDALRDRTLRRLHSLDNLTFVFWGLLYLGVILFLFPGWLAIAADASHTYVQYENPWQGTLGTVLFFNLPAGFCIALGLLAAPQPSLRALIIVIGWAVVASTISPIVQNKMFPYHFVPLKIELGMLCGLTVLLTMRQWLDKRWTLAVSAIVVACAGATAAKNVYSVIHDDFRNNTIAQVTQTQLYQVLHDQLRGKTVMTLSTVGGPLAVLLYSDATVGTRFLALQDLPHVVANTPLLDRIPPKEAARVTRLAAFMKAAAVEDLATNRPDFVLFETTQNLVGLPTGFDVQGYFLQSPAFAAELSGYRLYVDDRISDGRIAYGKHEYSVYQRR